MFRSLLLDPARGQATKAENGEAIAATPYESEGVVGSSRKREGGQTAARDAFRT